MRQCHEGYQIQVQCHSGEPQTLKFQITVWCYFSWSMYCSLHIVYVCVHACVSVCRPEHHSSGAVHLDFCGRVSLTGLGFAGQTRLGWLTSKHQGCPALGSQHWDAKCDQPGLAFLCAPWGFNSCFISCTLLTKLPSQYPIELSEGTNNLPLQGRVNTCKFRIQLFFKRLGTWRVLF